MISWIDVLANQERYRDIRREAERERLVRQALAARGKPAHFYGPALIWLGRRLIAWGKASYAAPAEAPRLQPADRTRGAC